METWAIIGLLLLTIITVRESQIAAGLSTPYMVRHHDEPTRRGDSRARRRPLSGLCEHTLLAGERDADRGIACPRRPAALGRKGGAAAADTGAAVRSGGQHVRRRDRPA